MAPFAGGEMALVPGSYSSRQLSISGTGTVFEMLPEARV